MGTWSGGEKDEMARRMMEGGGSVSRLEEEKLEEARREEYEQGGLSDI